MKKQVAQKELRFVAAGPPESLWKGKAIIASK
jgi:hypothetical protein